MTFPRIFARQAYWADHPPMPRMLRLVAQWCGVWKPAVKIDPRETMDRLRVMFPSGKI